MKKKIMELVKNICNTGSTDCRGLNKVDSARELMNIANIPISAEVQEIPLDWDNQVVILFLLPTDNNYYSLFAGVGTDNNFHFELTITGILKDNEFDFFEKENELDINYFTVKKSMETIDFKARENEIKNSYIVNVADGDFTIMQKDFYFSETLNDYQDYWIIYKPYKTLNGAISGLKKLVAQHFPADYFKHNDINEFVKVMIQ